jgi:hypothetical protein
MIDLMGSAAMLHGYIRDQCITGLGQGPRDPQLARIALAYCPVLILFSTISEPERPGAARQIRCKKSGHGEVGMSLAFQLLISDIKNIPTIKTISGIT